MVKEKRAIQCPDDRYSFTCPHCAAQHKRGMWSVAHFNITQMFTCTCGNQIILPRMKD
jgi:hypothetical protein